MEFQNDNEHADSVLDGDFTKDEADHSRTPAEVKPPSSYEHGELSETAHLHGLNAQIRSQEDLERNIALAVERASFEQDILRDQRRLEKTKAQKEKIQEKISKTKYELSRPIGISQGAQLRLELKRLQEKIQDLDNDTAEIEERMVKRQNDVDSSRMESTGGERQPNESLRDFFIRTGKITPFSKFGLSSRREAPKTLQEALNDAEEEPESNEALPLNEVGSLMSHRNLKKPGFAAKIADFATDDELDLGLPRKRRKLRNTRPTQKEEDASYDEAEADSTEDPSVTESNDSEEMPSTVGNLKRTSRKAATLANGDVEDFRGVDDGNESMYKARLRSWALKRSRARNHVENNKTDAESMEDEVSDLSPQELLKEVYLPHPKINDTEFDGGYRIPGDIFPNLFDYQKTGVQWLYELHIQQVGGIIGDEMGLGKTIQMIAFLAGLHYSKRIDKPIIVVCPATVMKQWVNEFHRWWPPFRVTILHSSGSGMINVRNESSKEDELFEQIWDPENRNKKLTASQKRAEKLLSPVLNRGGVLVTTYSGLQMYAPLLIPVNWQYAILDEGHKIRNPNAAITIYAKELRTPNRIILSGTPMQNNLIELWSLFDFVFPMRLGTLVNFRNQFDIPIRQGGYANASNLQVQTAFKCAETLKDAISAYLLQRFKIDVAADLPKKSEQVLFCKLTKYQREDYERFLKSGDMDAIMLGKRQVLYGIDICRKICNHPDLQDHKRLEVVQGENYGNPSKSGKMQVVGSLLQLWRDTGHKALLFAQHRIMLDILEKFVRSMRKLKYRRMDGNTPIALRQSIVDEFNTDPDLHVFLLTTKVGGLGVNLTGADRVIIYDPDWNPSTDLQARERAWRLGQKRDVTIYRLMTAGTIEEKIYHRQLFKQFLTNKVLKDPKQRQKFHLSDLHDLFSLGSDEAPTETSALFQNAQVKTSGNQLTAKPKGDKTGMGIETVEVDTIAVKTLSGVSSMEQYAGEVAEEEQAKKDGAPNSESRMMEGIFARSNIHSTMEHDAIMSGSNIGKNVAADPVLIEQEAKRVAAEAARELRRTGEIARTVPAGTPTWTGQFGVSGRPHETTPQRAFGSSTRNKSSAFQSSSLLTGLQHRQLGSSSGNATPRTASPSRSLGSAPSTSSRPPSPPRPTGKDFARLIRDYMMVHGGSAYTQMLVDHFHRFCKTPPATMDFKESLKAIATLEKGSRSRGRWTLKEEYKH